MKKLGGILALPVRALFFKVLAVTAATAAAQVAAVLLRYNAVLPYLSDLQRESHTLLLAAVGFAAVTALLALHGCQFSGVKTDYTLRRLPVTEERVVCLWALAYLGFLVLFWAVELGVVLFQWRVVTRELTYRPAPLAAESYLNGFFHGLLPLEDWPRPHPKPPVAVGAVPGPRRLQPLAAAGTGLPGLGADAPFRLMHLLLQPGQRHHRPVFLHLSPGTNSVPAGRSS